MKMQTLENVFSLTSFTSLCILVSVNVCTVVASSDITWCYHGCEESPSFWHSFPESYCGGDRQSPINIDTSQLTPDPNLRDFTFTNFSHPQIMKYIVNTGHTVSCVLEEGLVEVRGGGLSHSYSPIVLHFHWGDYPWHPGSEHAVDSHRYPMEMHLVTLKENLTMEQAKSDPAGLAVFGFFIDVTDGAELGGAWQTLTSYLHNITEKDATVDVLHSVSISDLLGDVDLAKFYRYQGSLTTPACEEAVVWTVFEEPIKMSRDLIELFPKTTKYRNLYRPLQNLNSRKVSASPAVLKPAGHSWCYNDGDCEDSPSFWHSFPESYCGGDRQSPINIDTSQLTPDPNLHDFTFTNFSHPQIMKYIVNTGHTVQCVLEEGAVWIGGGALRHQYSAMQIHFHWGDASETPAGSEHTVDHRRYPMESRLAGYCGLEPLPDDDMHLVSVRKGWSMEQASQHSEGIAVLGFFIEVTDEEEGPEGWRTLTSYLSQIEELDSAVQIHNAISIDSLLGQVDRSIYYRYWGSLTTPECNEAVVWTMFKQPIRVSRNAVRLFPAHTGYGNTYRPTQRLQGRVVHSSESSSPSLPGPSLALLLTALRLGAWLGRAG